MGFNAWTIIRIITVSASLFYRKSVADYYNEPAVKMLGFLDWLMLGAEE